MMYRIRFLALSEEINFIELYFEQIVYVGTQVIQV